MTSGKSSVNLMSTCFVNEMPLCYKFNDIGSDICKSVVYSLDKSLVNVTLC